MSYFFKLIFLPGLFYTTIFYHDVHGMPICKWDIIVDYLECIFFFKGLRKNAFGKYK